VAAVTNGIAVAPTQPPIRPHLPDPSCQLVHAAAAGSLNVTGRLKPNPALQGCPRARTRMSGAGTPRQGRIRGAVRDDACIRRGTQVYPSFRCAQARPL